MKTLLINIFDSNIAKNILRTNVLEDLLKVDDLKIVLLVHANKIDFYKSEFEQSNVVVDVLPSKSQSFLEILANFIVRSSIPAHTVRQIMEEGLDGGGRLRIDKYIVARICWLLGHSSLYRRSIRKILIKFFQDEIFKDVLKKHRPNLIFSPTIYSTSDLRLIKQAHKQHIPIVGMIKSWDNLTSKDFVMVYPDLMIVHNEIIANELEKLTDFPKEKVKISGMPQFDCYVKEDFIESREDFFSKLGLDPTKKVILYSAMGSWLVPKERAIIKLLAKIINNNELNFDAQLLVRLHPAYTSEDEKLSNISNIIIDRPGSFRSTTDSTALRSGWEFQEADIKHLAATIKYADVAINEGSTMSIECACFDTPLINLNFDADFEDVPYWQSVKRLFKREHYLPLVKSGGIRFPNNYQELISDINDYLSDSQLDQSGRQRIVREQCYQLDGQSGSRIANFIINYLNNAKK